MNKPIHLYFLTFYLIVVFVINAPAQKDSKITEGDSSKKKKPEVIIQPFDQRNSFIHKHSVNINGAFVGLLFNNRSQYSIGVYTTWSPFQSNLPNVINDSTTESIKFNIYFASLGYTRTIYTSKNDRFELSIPFEIGFGYAQATATRYFFASNMYSQQVSVSRSTNFIPAQLGIFGEYKINKLFGVNLSVGYRELILERLFPYKVNYNGLYYNYGLNVYFSEALKSYKILRKKIKERQDLQETKNKLIFKTGLSYAMLRDNSISTYEYNSFMLPVNIQFIHTGPKNYYSFSGLYRFNLTNYTTATDEGFSYSNYLPGYYGISRNQVGGNLLDIKANYARKLLSDSKLSISGGGEAQYISVNKNFPALKYYDQIKEQVVSLNAFVTGSYKFSSRDYISFTLSSPLAAYIPKNYLVNFSQSNSYNSLTTLSNYQAVNAGINYSFRFSNAVSAELGYNLFYMQYNKPEKEQLEIHSLLMGVVYNF